MTEYNEWAHSTINAEILEPYERYTIKGKFIERLPHGIVIDDCRGIRHFAFNDRVISAPDMKQTVDKPPGCLF